MFSAIVSENRNGSCGTKPMAPRSVASGISRTSTPSMKTVPGGGSCSRGSRLMSVDLPEPVGPTIATVCPAATVSETSRDVVARSRDRNVARETRSRRDRGADRPSGVPRVGDGRHASSTSSIRFHDAMPRCRMLVTQPKAIIGQASITR